MRQIEIPVHKILDVNLPELQTIVLHRTFGAKSFDRDITRVAVTADTFNVRRG